MTCAFEYKGLTYPPEYKEPMKSHHYSIVNAVEKSEIGFRKYQGQGSKFRIPVDNRAEAEKFIASINKTYGKVLKTGKALEGRTNAKSIMTNIMEVDVSDMADTLFHRSQAQNRLTQEEQDNQYNIAGEVMPTQEDRIYKGSQIDNLERANYKASVMEQRFQELGIESKLLYDTTMEANGKLLGKDTQEYKDLVSKGTIQEGQAAIVVNPNKLYEDTIFHEYGHLLVDLLNGSNDARISSIYDRLTTTSLYQQIKEAYPELNAEQLKREVVTQALGVKANELFQTQEDESVWKKFMMWVKNTFNRLFNIENGEELTQLANELLGNKEVDQIGEISNETRYQKNSKEFKAAKIIKRDLSTLENIKGEIFNTINRQVKILSRIENESVQKYVETLKAMNNEIKALDKNADELAILKYVDKVSDQLEKMNSLISSTKMSNKGKINLLGGFREQLESFKLLADIRKSITDTEIFPEDVFEKAETRQALIDRIDTVQNVINTTHINLQTEAINKVSLHLTDYLNYAEVEARDRYFIQFNKNNIDREQDAAYKKEREEFIQEQLEANAPELRRRNRELIKEKLRKSSADIGLAALLFNDEKDQADLVIQLISKVIDDADLKRDMFMMSLKIEAQEAFNKWKEKFGSDSNPAKTFDTLYEVASDNQAYLTTEYSAEFYIALNKLKMAKGEAADKKGLKSKEYKKASKDLSDFLRINTDRGVPTAKWKNKNYDKVKDTELYQWLRSRSNDNNDKLQGKKSNIVASVGHNLIKLPNISKSGFEELSSGSMLKNALERFKTLYQTRPDDTKYGEVAPGQEKDRKKQLFDEIDRRIKAGESVEELAEEINMLQVMTNEVGDVQTSIPIFFRGQTDIKNQSFDLPSIMLMDSYMSENYSQKTKTKYTIDLVGDLIKNREVSQTKGFSKKSLVQLVGKNERVYEEVRQMLGRDSNAERAFQSMIENRLYGIKTINKEYAQLASSLMSWTASAMLGFNFLAASANVIQGKVTNFIESVGGQWYDGKDLRKAESLFWGDMGAWMDDAGRPVQTSKTNQLLDLFNIQGEFKPFTNRLNEDSRFKTLFKKNTLFAYNHMGEFYIHSTLMYGILNRIKVKNSKGQYIDKKGNVVTKAKSMSLHEAFSVNKDTNQLELNKFAKSTSFGTQTLSLDNLDKDKAILEVKNLINKIANDLHGQYNDEYQSLAQRYVVGQMVFMLRKWIVRGFNRRWRGVSTGRRKKEALMEKDKFYSEDLQSFQEGYYTTFIRFMSRLIGNIKQLQWSGAVTEAKSGLSEHEIANLRKTFAELGVLGVTLLAAMFTEMAADGIDPDDEEAYLYLFFYSRRLYSELSFFADPSSTFDILRSPAASASYAEDIVNLFSQVVEDGGRLVEGEGLEYYERGKNKGYPKLWKRTTDLFPIANHLNRSIYESASYVGNTN